MAAASSGRWLLFLLLLCRGGALSDLEKAPEVPGDDGDSGDVATVRPGDSPVTEKDSVDAVGVGVGDDVGVGSPKVNNTAKIMKILEEIENLRDSRKKDEDEEEWSSKLLGKIEEVRGLGSSQATQILGELYLLGEGVERNFSSAMTYFQEAADDGNPRAQMQLGFMYGNGFHDNGTQTRDQPLSFLHYYFAAVGGVEEAQMVLGYKHLYGYDVPKSCDAAIKYYSSVAQRVVMHYADKSIAKPIELIRLSDDKARANKLEEAEDVIQYYQHSADNGNAEAQVALGQLNFYGARGVEQNTRLAAQYFRAAADQGNAAAMSNLAQMHIQGLGVKENNETAFKYFQKAAGMGDAAAQNGLGFMYLHGYGTKQDHKNAMKYFKMSAEQGNVDAQFNLGAMYFAGMGIEVDYGAALSYFTLAGHQGHVRSLFNLAQMHMNGLGTVQSCPIAVKLFKSVSERGKWARDLSSAHRNYLREHYEAAFLKYSMAAEQGYEMAQSNVAWLVEKEIGFPKEFPTDDQAQISLQQLERAAKQGNVDAQRMIGDHYYYGQGTAGKKPNFKEAARYYTMAGEQKNAHANFNLGFMHQHGIGLPLDLHLAKRFYDLALESSPDAYVPVQLALFALNIHHFYLRFMTWWDSEGVKPIENSSKGESGTESVDKGAEAAKESTKKTGKGKKSSVSWEDALLLFACGLLAILVYIRSRRAA